MESAALPSIIYSPLCLHIVSFIKINSHASALSSVTLYAYYCCSVVSGTVSRFIVTMDPDVRDFLSKHSRHWIVVTQAALQTA